MKSIEFHTEDARINELSLRGNKHQEETLKELINSPFIDKIIKKRFKQYFKSNPMLFYLIIENVEFKNTDFILKFLKRRLINRSSHALYALSNTSICKYFDDRYLISLNYKIRLADFGYTNLVHLLNKNKIENLDSLFQGKFSEKLSIYCFHYYKISNDKYLTERNLEYILNKNIWHIESKRFHNCIVSCLDVNSLSKQFIDKHNLVEIQKQIALSGHTNFRTVFPENKELLKLITL